MEKWLVRPIAIGSEMLVHVPEIEQLAVDITTIAESWTPEEPRPAPHRPADEAPAPGTASALYDAIDDTPVPRNPRYWKSYHRGASRRRGH